MLKFLFDEASLLFRCRPDGIFPPRKKENVVPMKEDKRIPAGPLGQNHDDLSSEEKANS